MVDFDQSEHLRYTPDKRADAYYGRVIISAVQEGDNFDIAFDDGAKIRIHDDGQCCCERRYMECDDDPSRLVGKRLLKIEVKDVDEAEGSRDEDYHEIQFLDVIADDGTVVTFSTHNEHNGYYGGFCLGISEIA